MRRLLAWFGRNWFGRLLSQRASGVPRVHSLFYLEAKHKHPLLFNFRDCPAAWP